MALAPIRVKWSYLLTPSESTSFVVETRALQASNAVYSPVLRFHNIGTEDCDLEIEYKMDLGSGTDDPLNSGSYTNVVVSVSIPAGQMYTYDFDGQHLDSNAAVTVTHTITIVNNGVANQIYHTVLTGHVDVGTQFSAGQITFS